MNKDEIQAIGEKKMLWQLPGAFQDPMDWIDKNAPDIERFLAAEGALLIRGLPIDDSDRFGRILKKLFGEDLAAYTYRSTPRTALENNIYTATEYHHSETIPQHNENSYAHSWPQRIGFLCLVPPARSGNTPVSDSRVAYREIPAEIRDEFERKKIMYVRNYSRIDLPWTEVFQTRDKEQVESYCRENDIALEWLADDGLRTRQIGQASILHPGTHEKLWFNQAHLFHISSLDEEMAEDLISLLGEENLPRNACFGDGTPIEKESLAIIRQVYERTKFSFTWERNDLLLLDNMLFTHGREPFDGPRKVLVGMARPYGI